MTLFLIDEPLKGDHRVLTSLEKINNPEIVNCLDVSPLENKFFILINTYIFLKSFVKAPFEWFYLYKTYNLIPKSFFQGLKTSIMTNYKALKIFKALKEKYKDCNIDTIYANDLMCATIGFHLAKYFKVNLIYDAHEIEFHRNRKNSFFRVAFDIAVEKEVIKQTSIVTVVNTPIKKLYQEIYNISHDKIKVIDNNHFKPYINYALNVFSEDMDKIAIVYVGGGIGGRKLENLTRDNQTIGTDLYGYFLATVPDFAYGNNWILESKEYLSELMKLIKHKRCVMWCCVDDICLSYRLSLPNKFFQAMALGIPVIAYKGTYLSELINKYNLGYIYDDNNLYDIVNDIKINKKYEKLLLSVSAFQNKLFTEKLEL